MPKKANLFRFLVLLSMLFIAAQITFLAIGELFADLVTITRFSFSPRLIFSEAIFPQVLEFLAAQLVVYGIYIFVVWYVVTAICELLRLRPVLAYLLCFVLWANTVVSLLLLNAYLVPHSIFSKLLLHDLLEDKLTPANLHLALQITITINAIAALLAFVWMIIEFMRAKHLLRHIAYHL